MNILEEKIANGFDKSFVDKYINPIQSSPKEIDSSLPDLTSLDSIVEWYKREYLKKYGIPMSRKQTRMLISKLKKNHGL